MFRAQPVDGINLGVNACLANFLQAFSNLFSDWCACHSRVKLALQDQPTNYGLHRTDMNLCQTLTCYGEIS